MGQVQEIALVMELVDRFLSMLRTLQEEQLEDWMHTAQQSTIREIHNFVEQLRKDQQAVQAGLTLNWNNGVVEGHVNRLKCLTRKVRMTRKSRQPDQGCRPGGGRFAQSETLLGQEFFSDTTKTTLVVALLDPIVKEIVP